MLSANPMFAGNPQLQEQMRTQLPNMVQQVGTAFFRCIKNGTIVYGKKLVN